MLAALTACASEELRPSEWPPDDFELTVEELRVDEGLLQVVRRVCIDASGLVVYASAARSLVDTDSHLALPVFDRLSIYRLVPTSVRGLARRLYRLGVTELDPRQGEPAAQEATGIGLTWQAFHERRVLSARGRVHGPMADILGVVMSHMPDGEVFASAGIDRPVVSVLRGVPAPKADAAEALAALRGVLAERPEDATLLLDAYALACDLHQRGVAQELLTRWQQLTAKQGPSSKFADAAPTVTAAALERLLPPG